MRNGSVAVVLLITLIGSIVISRPCHAFDSLTNRITLFKSQLTTPVVNSDISISLAPEAQALFLQSKNKSYTPFRPEISLFISSDIAAQTSHGHSNLSENRSDRYKNTIPAIYRLTLKGYSIVEYSDYTTQTWSLNKVSEKALRGPEIMFSISKRF